MSNKMYIKGRKCHFSIKILIIFLIIITIICNKYAYGMTTNNNSTSSNTNNNINSNNNAITSNNNNANSNEISKSSGTVKKDLNSNKTIIQQKPLENNNNNNVLSSPTISPDIASINEEKNPKNIKTLSSSTIQTNAHISSSSSDNVKNTNSFINTRNSSDNYDIPDSFRVSFYIFIGLGVIAVLFFSFRSYRLRLSRAERRYGVQGDRRAQELTPLPIATEDDSDAEDHTVFDIHKQIRIS